MGDFLGGHEGERKTRGSAHADLIGGSEYI
jgi:hypothetical protein